MTTKRKPNRLIVEKSPYLLQHAYNPVNWYAWSEEAFDKAERENKPIFLSIGYSTCHWCHVMERESFEDKEVADLLNEHFVAIKVDREERPDIDHIYMKVCQAMTGQGGWPLTIVMTPEKRPFLAATYIPKHQKYGRYGLMDLLPRLHQLWEDDRDKLLSIGNEIVEEMDRQAQVDLSGSYNSTLLDKAYNLYKQQFDSKYGGFGGAPKFPASHNLSFLLRYYHRTGKELALQMVEKTLDAMARGGIYDHIGFGFARYSVDEAWLVPHFEKMLYDNALLAWTYLETYQITQKPAYAEVAAQIFTYVLRDLTDPEGGFYCAEDADSEGVEGKFYVWTPDEVRSVLGAEDGNWFCEIYDITDEGNFEGNSIPNQIQLDLEQYSKRSGIPLDDIKKRADLCRRKLFATREQRVHPHKDDKILTSWNSLMIMALAKGFQVLGREEYLHAAAKAVSFILDKLRRPDGRLLARYRKGEAAYPSYVDDYAFLVWGLLEMYEASLDPEYLALAAEINTQMLDLFWDEDQGGLFFYGNDNEELFTRNKEIYDGALPSGNSVAAYNLTRLSRLMDSAELSGKADQMFEAFAGAVGSYPPGYSMYLIALETVLWPSREIVIAGDSGKESTRRMLRVVQQTFDPQSILILVEDGKKGERVRELVPFVQDKASIDGKTTAYVCDNLSCKAPVMEAAELEQSLSRKEK